MHRKQRPHPHSLVGLARPGPVAGCLFLLSRLSPLGEGCGHSKPSVAGSSKAHDSAALEPSRGLLGAGKKQYLRVSPPQAGHTGVPQQPVVPTRAGVHPSGLCVFCPSHGPGLLHGPEDLSGDKEELLPIAALSHLTEDAVMCDGATPLLRLGRYTWEPRSLPFESHLELGFGPCPMDSQLVQYHEENTSVIMLTRTKLFMIHYTF